jgi:transposase
LETDPTRVCELLLGLTGVAVIGVDLQDDDRLVVHIETKATVAGCPRCGVVAVPKERKVVELVDMTCFGRPVVTAWHKRRFTCADPDCEAVTFTETATHIAFPRKSMTDRVGREMTLQVGRYARSVCEVAKDHGCDWHTVNDAVIAYGGALVDEPDRYGAVEALGLDEVLFRRVGTYRRQEYSTQLVDVARAQLLDVVPGRGKVRPVEWLDATGEEWKAAVKVGTMDMSSAYKAVFDEALPHATQVVDPFHLVKHANAKLDECRRRVQNETLGHRGHKNDPLYRCRKLLVKAHERLDENGEQKLLGLLAAGDPKGQVTDTWHAKEAVREIYTHTDAALAEEWIDELVRDMSDKDRPPEVRSLAKTLKRWKAEIVAWHTHQRTNGPTEAVNNLVKRVKRGAFGFRSFDNYRVRSLLYAGRPNWSRLATGNPY